TDRLLELTGLSDVAAKDVSDIPTGRARVVEVARALMTNPRILLLDEPASGQTEQETEVFAQMLTDLAAGGLGICL
ncbi:ATP-binding cassette domain-containing protein, partial [Rhodococcus globerulus]